MSNCQLLESTTLRIICRSFSKTKNEERILVGSSQPYVNCKRVHDIITDLMTFWLSCPYCFLPLYVPSSWGGAYHLAETWLSLLASAHAGHRFVPGVLLCLLAVARYRPVRTIYI